MPSIFKNHRIEGVQVRGLAYLHVGRLICILSVSPPNVTHEVTSVRRYRFRSNHIYPVPALHLPCPNSPETIQAFPSGQKQAALTDIKPPRSTSKRRGRPSKTIDGSDDEYCDPGTSKGDSAVEDGPSPKRRPRSTRAASLRSSIAVRPPPPPTTMDQPLVIDSDDDSVAEDGANAKQGVGAAGM